MKGIVFDSMMCVQVLSTIVLGSNVRAVRKSETRISDPARRSVDPTHRHLFLRKNHNRHRTEHRSDTYALVGIVVYSYIKKEQQHCFDRLLRSALTLTDSVTRQRGSCYVYTH